MDGGGNGANSLHGPTKNLLPHGRMARAWAKRRCGQAEALLQQGGGGLD